MSERIMGAFTCRICDRTFPLIVEKHYVARECVGNGVLSSLASTEPKLHDAFDCPHCGCQNLVGARLRVNVPTPEQVDDGGEDEEDEEEDK